jgi:hypothetical protein
MIDEEETYADDLDAGADSPSWKEAVLADFRRWLDAIPDDDLDEDVEGDEPADSGDLLRLAGEMTALRQEVRLMGRNTGKLLKTVEDVSRDVTTNVVPLVDEIRRLDRAGRTSETRGVLGPLLLEIGDLRDSLREVLGQVGLVSRPWMVSKQVWEKIGIERQQGNLKTMIRRIESVLDRNGVKAIAAEGMAFDAACMTVEGVSRAGQVKPGQVSNIVKQGYSLAGGLLRPAVVIVEEE